MTATAARTGFWKPHRPSPATAIALVVLIASQHVSNAAAQGIIEPQQPYVEVAAMLEPWLAAELQAKGIPALSIALVDDQKIVWARGFGFADPAKQVPGHGRYRLPRRVGVEALHRPRRHAARRARQDRSRRPSLEIRTGVRPQESVQGRHHASAAHVASRRGWCASRPPAITSTPPRLPSKTSSAACRPRAWSSSPAPAPSTRTRESPLSVPSSRRSPRNPSPPRSTVHYSGRWAWLARASQPSPQLSTQHGSRNDVDVRRSNRGDSHLPARHRPRRKPRLVSRRSRPFLELPLRQG